jgi:hypothetical protein
MARHTRVSKQIYRHALKQWEVSIVELRTENGRIFKVTRRLPELTVAETKLFRTKDEALAPFDAWLQ